MIDFIGGNLALGLALVVAIGVGVVRNRRAVAEPLRANQRGWRVLARVAYGSLAALVLWGTLADSWRKLLGEALDTSERYASQRIVQNPVPESIRGVTMILLAAALVTCAPLVGRYVGGYGLQIALLVSGTTGFLILFTLRQRLDTMLVTVDRLPPAFSAEMLATLVFILLDYAINVALLVLTFLALLGLVALPATFVLDRRHARELPVDGSADNYYAAFRENNAARRHEPPTGSADNR